MENKTEMGMSCGRPAEEMENVQVGDGGAGEVFFCEGCKQLRPISEEYTRCEDATVCNTCAQLQIDEDGASEKMSDRRAMAMSALFGLSMACFFSGILAAVKLEAGRYWIILLWFLAYLMYQCAVKIRKWEKRNAGNNDCNSR